MNEPVNAVIFEGGSPGSLVERELAAVRAAALLDNLDKLNRVKEIGQVYLATNNRRLAELWRARGDGSCKPTLPFISFRGGAKTAES